MLLISRNPRQLHSNKLTQTTPPRHRLLNNVQHRRRRIRITHQRTQRPPHLRQHPLRMRQKHLLLHNQPTTQTHTQTQTSLQPRTQQTHPRQTHNTLTKSTQNTHPRPTTRTPPLRTRQRKPQSTTNTQHPRHTQRTERTQRNTPTTREPSKHQKMPKPITHLSTRHPILLNVTTTTHQLRPTHPSHHRQRILQPNRPQQITTQKQHITPQQRHTNLNTCNQQTIKNCNQTPRRRHIRQPQQTPHQTYTPRHQNHKNEQNHILLPLKLRKSRKHLTTHRTQTQNNQRPRTHTQQELHTTFRRRQKTIIRTRKHLPQSTQNAPEKSTLSSPRQSRTQRKPRHPLPIRMHSHQTTHQL